MCREVWEQCWQEERCEKRAEKTKQHAKGMEAKKTAATFRISEFDLREWAETYQKRGKRIKNESNDTRSLPATMYTYVYMLWLVCTCTCNTPNRSIYERCTNQVHFFSLRFHLFLYLSTNSDNFAFYSCTNPDLPNNLILFRIVEECQLDCCIRFIAYMADIFNLINWKPLSLSLSLSSTAFYVFKTACFFNCHASTQKWVWEREHFQFPLSI